ncbi:MAG: type I-U CRISPR-associated protein Csx17 [Lentisphaerae bacterium]|nr:type I-U CRISPR-associated protein Csx17 [Lentisphaerota bacterium]
MSIHIHHLTGCAPTPLAHYLKALGILRLVAQQKDPEARGWWQDEAFHLATRLDREALERFFLEEYAPTPIVAPWNGGSGFYPKDRKAGLNAITASAETRFAPFSQAVTTAKAILGTRSDAAKGNEKASLMGTLRSTLRSGALEAMDAAVVIGANSDPSYPSLLGTGWNDGRLDFSNNFMQRLAELFLGGSRDCPPPDIASSLWHRASPGAHGKTAIGQFLPGGAGGANATTGPEGVSQVNPWDFVLMLEGAILLRAAVTRRIEAHSASQAAAPFAIRPASCGYASASRSERDTRGEQWMPLWTSPSTLTEISRVFADGRAQLGRSRVSRPVDFARSVARMGVARGIAAFQRFGYLERNGQANLAVPLGRWEVMQQPHQNALDDLDRTAWLDRLQRAARDDHAPASLVTAHRAADEAIMAVCAHGSETERWQALLLALTDVEAQLVRGGGFTQKCGLQPIPPLSAGWIVAAGNDSTEFRLAVALALQAADDQGHDPVRHHWLPLQEGARRFATDAGGLRKDPRVVCTGIDAERDLIGMVSRRLVEGSKGAASRLPLVAAPGFHARRADVAALLSGTVDLAHVWSLARALMALDRQRLRDAAVALASPQARDEPPPLYGLFRLACLPWPLCLGTAEVHIRCDPAVFARLSAGDIQAAGDIAIRRLKAVGLVPVLRHVVGDRALARRLAVSMAFPICQRDAARLAERLTKPQTQE